ncbi:MAG: 4-hydroxythreonine-4-phosphate dehydrogenase PdxA [Pyrinomonadaceae bacterium]
MNESNLEKAAGNRKPIIGITIGDAAGIGPEVVIKALLDKTVNKNFCPVLIGDASVLFKTAEELNLDLHAIIVKEKDDLPENVEQTTIYDLNNLKQGFDFGVESAETGRASAENITAAVGFWSDGKIDAIATAPISKNAIRLGGYNFPGHTEFLAELTGTKDFAMSFFADKLRVVLLSTHISLTDAIDFVRTENLVRLIRFSAAELARLLKKEVTLAVAGLNPHASEGGMFGKQEQDEIKPAIEICRRDFGINVSGAYSPDTIFLRAFRGEFDGVIACYHDQATIAVKCLSFGASVNVTLGLPLIRTSVDHGTAFDIAGKGIADASSMKSAINLAAKLTSH